MNVRVSFGEKTTSFDVTATTHDKSFDASFKAPTTDTSFEVTSDSRNEPFDASVDDLNVVHDGQNGATFTPDVSEDGVLSWTNDRDLPNPKPVNIKGEKGDKGERGEKGDKGDRGERGLQGAPGIQGIPGEKGERGERGADGESVTHKWFGTTLYVTSASGISSANLKGDQGERGERGLQGLQGEKGDKGDRGDTGAKGKDGKDGYTPRKGVDYFDGVNGRDGHTPVKGVDYFDGVNGADGKDGHTPIKGVDYFTESEKQEIVSDVMSALPLYEGDYVATPKVGEQTLPTTAKVMVGDVTIKAIPFFNTSNTSGGSTVYIGNEV